MTKIISNNYGKVLALPTKSWKSKVLLPYKRGWRKQKEKEGEKKNDFCNP